MSYFKTPGVYIKEQDAFGSSVVAVPTAVPAFVGYTQKADIDGNSQSMKAVKIKSLPEYREIFGANPMTTFKVGSGEDGLMSLDVDDGTEYYMYSSVRMFYANGGGECYVVSIGVYGDAIDAEKMKEALDVLSRETEPTILLIPDAMLLERNDCYSIYKDMLQHCGVKMKNRVALLDIHGGHNAKTSDKDVQDFREGVGATTLAFGAAYYPWVHTTVVSPSEIDYRRVSNKDDLVKLLMNDIKSAMFGGEAPASANPKAIEAQKLIDSIKDDLSNLDDVGKKLAAIDKGFTKPKEKDGAKVREALTKKNNEIHAGGAPDSPEARKLAQIEKTVQRVKDPNDDPKAVHAVISSLAPIYKTICKNVREHLNLLPPSGAMAGIYSLVDSQEGVHKAPANVSMNTVVRPAVNITSDDQEDLNSPLSGKAINAIRSFVGKGVLVWGARSLDANSQDWRYISVRRTMIMIQQSIKNSVEAYVFEPNVSRTWLKLKTSIENFLTDVWKNGSLAGATPTQAFEVSVGLGSTMTPNDILEGIMRVSVKCAITRPAEFIEITFEQKMQES